MARKSGIYFAVSLHFRKNHLRRGGKCIKSLEKMLDQLENALGIQGRFLAGKTRRWVYEIPASFIILANFRSNSKRDKPERIISPEASA